MKPLIVCLDRQTLPHPPLRPAVEHEWREHAMTSAAEVVERLQGATIAISNKVALGREQLRQLPQLKLIAVAATGYNIVDLEACRELGIAVCNVPSYSTDGVAEHTLMLMLMLRHRQGEYQALVANWPNSPIFCAFGNPIQELKGATLSLIGAGAIGGRVAELAQTLGMRVLRAERRGAAYVRDGHIPFEQALAEADIVSLHCPLNNETRGIIGTAQLALLKKSALLINTARGGLVDEDALALALQHGQLGGAALDVLAQEPPAAENALLKLKHPNLILTPHIAWAGAPSLNRLVQILNDNIEHFLAGAPQNRVA